MQIKDRPDAVELSDSKGGYGIQLENVRFGYRPEMPILQVKPSSQNLNVMSQNPEVHAHRSLQTFTSQVLPCNFHIWLEHPVTGAYRRRLCSSVRSYPTRMKLTRLHMQGLSMNVPVGSSSAHVGMSGSGKSVEILCS